MFCCAAAFSAPTYQPAPPEQIRKLAAVLKSDAPQKEKADACRELARIGTKDAVASLVALLPDEQLSHMARYGLETIPDSSVDNALREAAVRLQGRPLVGVIGSIGVRRDPKAVKVLARLLHTPDNEVAQAAARALGSIGNLPAAKVLQESLPGVSAANQLAFCEGLLRCAEAASARGNRQEAQGIYDRLREIPTPQQVRSAALRGAILVRQEEGLSLLTLALHNDDFTLVLAAARTAQEIPGPEVIRLLAGELAGLSVDRQILVIQTIARRSDAVALPALFTVARGGDKPVRIAGIRALAEIGDSSALPLLLELLDDSDQDIAAAAQESLASLPGTGVDAAIRKMLAEGAGDQGIKAMELIVRRHMISAIPALLDAAGSSSAKMRIAAVKKLGALAGPAQLPVLLELLTRAKGPEDLEAAEQAVSAISLRTENPVSCAGQVAGYLAQAEPAQKCSLLRVLGAIGGTNALQTVRATVNDPNPEVHAVAIRTLSGWSTLDAGTDLLQMARAASDATDRTICLRGYLALTSHADLPNDQRLAMCRQVAPLIQKDEEKRLLLAALAGIASAEAVEVIEPYLADAAMKEEASAGMVNMAEKILQGSDGAKVAPRLVEPLDKAAQATSSAELAKRAKDLRDQARNKAGAK